MIGAGGDEHAWQAASDRHQRELPHDRRKERGAWFTPMALALPTARRALAPLDDGRALRICDPAVGGGSFLLAAQQALRTSPARCTGVDVDAAAVAIARQALPTAELRCADGLTTLEAESYDAVLTNPPWETMRAADAAARGPELRRRFAHQGGSKLFTYRLFVERAAQLLRPGGRLGMIVPASLWFDHQAAALRALLLDTCSWQWLFGFENRERVFDIDSRYRFGVVNATKGARTERVQVAFGRTSLDDWQRDDPPATTYRRNELSGLSPHAGTFVEVESRRDLDVLARMHAAGRPLLGERGAFAWRQGDYNMTSDRARFVPRDRAEADGYRSDGRGVWRRDGHPDLLALRQGAMIYDLDGNAAAHDRGVGHKTRWRAPADPDELRPLYLVAADEWQRGAAERGPARIGLRALSNATNE
ncbi:MAG: N-6 DNA methylase, partial [Planctomycetes bacterium]|nr:N-6 DNA methylase [Planctomycetota bacterium]